MSLSGIPGLINWIAEIFVAWAGDKRGIMEDKFHDLVCQSIRELTVAGEDWIGFNMGAGGTSGIQLSVQISTKMTVSNVP